MFRPLLPVLLLLAAPASAHSELRGSVPAEGALLNAAPTELILRFNEPVQVTLMRLLDPAGQPVALRRAEDSSPRREARAAPAAPLAPGALRLEWRAISADGHPIRGTLRFTLEAP